MTAPSGSVTTVAPSDSDPAPAPVTDGIVFQVRRLSMTEVPILEDFAERVRAEGLRPQEYLLASGANEGITALVIAFDTTNESLLAGPTATPQGPATHLWIAIVVNPAEHLRHPDVALHAVLLEAFSTNPPVTAQLDQWSPATRTVAEPIHLDIVESEAAIVLDADGPFSYRITSEYAHATRNSTAHTMRLFGVADHQVTGFLDVQFPERIRHAGHGIATKGDPHDMTFPPAAGFSQLERALDDTTYTLTARHTSAPAAHGEKPREQTVPLGFD